METTRYRRLIILAASIAIGLFCLQPMAEAQSLMGKISKAAKSLTNTRFPRLKDYSIIGIMAGTAIQRQQDNLKRETGSRVWSPSHAIHTQLTIKQSTLTASFPQFNYDLKNTQVMQVSQRYVQTMEIVAKQRANMALRHPVTQHPLFFSIIKPRRLPKELLTLPKLSVVQP